MYTYRINIKQNSFKKGYMYIPPCVDPYILTTGTFHTSDPFKSEYWTSSPGIGVDWQWSVVTILTENITNQTYIMAAKKGKNQINPQSVQTISTKPLFRIYVAQPPIPFYSTRQKWSYNIKGVAFLKRTIREELHLYPFGIFKLVFTSKCILNLA